MSLLSCLCLTKEINYCPSVPHQASEQFVSTSSPSTPCKHYLYIHQFMDIAFSKFDNTGPPSTYQTQRPYVHLHPLQQWVSNKMQENT